MRYLLRLCFDGTAYSGYQRQTNADTVGQRLFEALRALFGSVEHMSGCSRTDSGVHARAFYVTFDAQERDCAGVVRALNALLPRDVAALDCCEAAPDFHARYSAKGKQYVYQIWNGAQRNPFYERYALHVPAPVDIDVLNRYAAEFVGTHDFTSFMASGSKITDPVRTVYDAHFERDGQMVLFFITANGFLYNMVRIIVGTLLDLESGRLCMSVPEMISGRSRALAGKTVAAHGLFLNRVYYKDEAVWGIKS